MHHLVIKQLPQKHLKLHSAVLINLLLEYTVKGSTIRHMSAISTALERLLLMLTHLMSVCLFGVKAVFLNTCVQHTGIGALDVLYVDYSSQSNRS